MHSRTLIRTPVLAGLAGVCLLGSACGGSPGSRVAQLGEATTTTESGLSSTSPVPSAEGDRQKLAFALTVARCMRAHGFPTYPDPATARSSSQGSGTRFEGTGIDLKSAKFQTAETNCEKQARKALGLP